MPYKNRIKTLEESIRLVENQIKGNTDPKRLAELSEISVKYSTELSKMRRVQWEHEHENIDFEDDR